LSYLADQLLKGCQSADNQFQALQNQEIAGFSVFGSRLPELEAEVVQIQLLWISLRSSLLCHLQTLLYFPIVLDFRTFLSVDIITLFTLILVRHLGGVFFFLITLFYPLSLCNKKGE
jgi:hypothetical protein